MPERVHQSARALESPSVTLPNHVYGYIVDAMYIIELEVSLSLVENSKFIISAG